MFYLTLCREDITDICYNFIPGTFRPHAKNVFGRTCIQFQIQTYHSQYLINGSEYHWFVNGCIIISDPFKKKFKALEFSVTLPKSPVWR